jgi:hypothetical protein
MMERQGTSSVPANVFLPSAQPTDPKANHPADQPIPCNADQPRTPLSLLARPNKYKALILLGEDSITNDNILLCTPYIINVKYKALICTHCKCAVTLESTLQHVHKHHPQCRVPKNFVIQLKSKYPTLATEKIHLAEVIDPVFGLAVPMEEYVICARCRCGYASMSSWHSHDCEQADVDLNAQPPYSFSLVQSFFWVL